MLFLFVVCVLVFYHGSAKSDNVRFGENDGLRGAKETCTLSFIFSHCGDFVCLVRVFRCFSLNAREFIAGTDVVFLPLFFFLHTSWAHLRQNMLGVKRRDPFFPR